MVDQDTADANMAHQETMLTVSNFKKACDAGRGGIMFCTSRGKIATSLKLTNHYSRCAVVFGIPF